jgi:hypothetical protein
MKKLLSCREVWCYNNCDYIVSGETEEDVVIGTAEHGILKHGKKEKDMASLGEKLRIHLYYILLTCDEASHYRLKNNKKNNNNTSSDD